MNSFSTARRFVFLGLLVLLGACATPTPPPAASSAASSAATAAASSDAARNAARDLAAGRRAYEEGDYKTATRLLQAGLLGAPTTRDRVTAHKYLAFMSCAQSQFEPCRAHFRNAFELNPQFSLTAAETGHPLWGPVFREVAAEDAAKRARRSK
jgi:Tfp pilus assembly protein PilF